MNKKIYKYLCIILIAMVIYISFLYKHCNSLAREYVTKTVTEYIYDTIPKTIKKTGYVVRIDTFFYPDSILIPPNIDTAAILIDYYNTYSYKRTWRDSTIKVDFTDFISRNRIINSSLLNYKLLKPQTIIVNKTKVINYNKYLNLNLNTPFDLNYYNIGISYIGEKFTYGVSYYPKENIFGMSFGFNFLKFK